MTHYSRRFPKWTVEGNRLQSTLLRRTLHHQHRHPHLQRDTTTATAETTGIGADRSLGSTLPTFVARSNPLRGKGGDAGGGGDDDGNGDEKKNENEPDASPPPHARDRKRARGTHAAVVVGDSGEHAKRRRVVCAAVGGDGDGDDGDDEKEEPTTECRDAVAERQLVELICAVLVWDPRKRLALRDLVGHAYFAPLRVCRPDAHGLGTLYTRPEAYARAFPVAWLDAVGIGCAQRVEALRAIRKLTWSGLGHTVYFAAVAILDHCVARGREEDARADAGQGSRGGGGAAGGEGAAETRGDGYGRLALAATFLAAKAHTQDCLTASHWVDAWSAVNGGRQLVSPKKLLETERYVFRRVGHNLFRHTPYTELQLRWRPLLPRSAMRDATKLLILVSHHPDWYAVGAGPLVDAICAVVTSLTPAAPGSPPMPAAPALRHSVPPGTDNLRTLLRFVKVNEHAVLRKYATPLGLESCPASPYLADPSCLRSLLAVAPQGV